MDGEELWRRRYERERKARVEAEELLERKSLELFRAKEQSEDANDMLLDALESMREGFLVIDENLRIVVANERYKEHYPTVAHMVRPGMSYPDLLLESARLGQYAGDYTPEDWARERLARALNPQGAWEQRLADGRILLVAERRTRRGGVVSVRSDITAQKKAEAERSHLQEQFNHAQRMESIGRLAGGIAHDFNNVLAAMLGYA